MKNFTKIIGIIALAAVIGFSFTACGPGSPAERTYTNEVNGQEYKLKIIQSRSFTPKIGDNYELTIVGTTKISSGTVTGYTSGTFTLLPSRTGAETFKVTVTGNSIDSFDQAFQITWDDGTKEPGPEDFTCDGDEELTGTISILPNADVKVGTELTATYNGTETVTYQWRQDYANVGTNSNKYTSTEAGSYTVTVSATGYNPKTSDAVDVTAVTYTVTFNNNGGSVVAQITDISSGDTINEPIPPTKSGFVFAGWYKEVGLVNAWNFVSDTVIANITLYAKWISNVLYSIEIMYIPSGTLDRGYVEIIGELNHTISLSAFKMSKYQITQELYNEVMGYNPSWFTGVNLPVEQVTWFDAVYFCNELSLRDSLTPVYVINDIEKSEDNILNATVTVPDWNVSGYRLPTDAQWEYAAWGGEVPNFDGWHFGDDSSLLGDYAWFDSNSGDTTHPVGEKLPNQYGLYDMHGNVWEWCWDWYDTYLETPGANYTGPVDGTWRILRGGGWDISAEFTRPSFRHISDPVQRGFYWGFRVVCP